MNATAAQDAHELLTPAEVALKMRVSAATVRRLIDRGEIAAFRVGHQWRIPASALQHTDEDGE
jgi:excisionase family DNA binding protein